ncbi:hypothetical protein PITCH_A400051 [uncultured Desulfobacterium sp.]|uniref:Uncharacterized protein n=1 Tax=uncultured Desulfobacterium sp. TaxID=201089 RepID=A0A445MZW3_9BACT|nr:hypothetical protein PITCH_A400051 [uncultured Desulfobacterium sp.]
MVEPYSSREIAEKAFDMKAGIALSHDIIIKKWDITCHSEINLVSLITTTWVLMLHRKSMLVLELAYLLHFDRGANVYIFE